MKLKRCPFCNSHNLSIEPTNVTWYVLCHHCRATGPESMSLNTACNLWNGDDIHQNKSALIRDRAHTNRDDLKEVEV